MIQKRTVIIGVIGIVLILFFFVAFLAYQAYIANNTPILPQSQQLVGEQGLSPDSEFLTSATSAQLRLRANKTFIYKSSEVGEEAARDFIANGINTDGSLLFPSNTQQTLSTSKLLKEKLAEHYYFEQLIDEIPVYGSSVIVHIRNGDEIYATEGKVLSTVTIPEPVVTEQQAKETALLQAAVDGNGEELLITKVEKTILNKQLIGFPDDASNYIVVAISVEGKSGLFYTTYFVDLVTGQILHQDSQVYDAKNRVVKDASKCSSVSNLDQCQQPIIRSENGPPTGNADADVAYDIIGTIYDYYSRTFGRDSYDSLGGVINILPNFPLVIVSPTGSSTDCKNAFWVAQYSAMVICVGMAVDDVLMHEFTHGVTIATSGLRNFAQSGSINESISDLMTTALDNDWTMGEDSRAGTIRFIDNPPSKNHPDRLFSENYLCTETTNCTSQNSYCGSHTNAGVLNKTGYLIAQGGSFNGCDMKGIGKQKMNAIVYRSILYLTPTANFSDMASALMQACEDLYDIDTCREVEKAIQATEMDQQRLGNQVSPRCTGVQAKVPNCRDTNSLPDSENPTNTPAYITPTNTPISIPTDIPITLNQQPSAIPTSVVQNTQCVPMYKPDENGCEQPTLVAPGANATQGPITFQWCTSTPQQRFFFRADYNQDSPNSPDVRRDEQIGGTITLAVPSGNHSWWVHSYCVGPNGGYLSKASGQNVSVAKGSGNQPTTNGVQPTTNTARPTSARQRYSTPVPPTVTVTPATGGSSQRVLE